MLTWDPLRVALATAALGQADATMAAAGEHGGGAMPVVIVGRLG